MLSTINLLPKAFVNLLRKLTTGNSGPQLSCAKLVLWLHLQFLFCKLRNGVWALNFIFANSLTEGASSAVCNSNIDRKSEKSIQNVFAIGLFRKQFTPLRRIGFWKFSREGGGGVSKTLEIQAGGGLNLKKSSTGVISTDSSRDSNF